MQDTSVIIAAAGSSSRMNGTDKQFADLCGIPVIGHSLLAFEKTEEILDIVVVTREENIDKIKETALKLDITKLTSVVCGGRTRQESVSNGINFISRETTYIAVHDGARPLVHINNIKTAVKDAHIFGASTLGVPVKDTIKSADDHIITDTIPREKLFIIQTPQIFRRNLYFEGLNFSKAHGLDFTDDCQMAEAVGGKIYITEGSYDNIKITTPDDLIFAKAVLEEKYV